MIKLTDLLKEEETFTATSKKSGETSVFKSKDSRDAAVKAGTHSKADDKEDDKPKKEKPNMFSKDGGYDAPDSPKKEPKSEPAKLKYGKDGKMTQASADSVEKELNKALIVLTKKEGVRLYRWALTFTKTYPELHSNLQYVF